MYIAKIDGHTVEVGDTVEINNLGDGLKFKVLEIKEASFGIEWTHKDANSQRDTLPFAIFGSHRAHSVWIPNSEDDPNRAFLINKRIESND